MPTIEKNIPMPTAGGRSKNMGEAHKLHEMEVGDSILIADNAEQRRVRSAFINRRDDLGEDFATRKVEGGRRFWRTK